MKCVVACLLALTLVNICVIDHANAEENYENHYNDQFYTEDLPGDIVVAPSMDANATFYAGPLKAAEDDEIIVVSRDNVQQLIKTLMLAYTHSKDPTMTQLFKSGGLGALKTTFKYLNREQLGNTILATAQNYISELNLEQDEEQLLGEFAEEFLEKHKFKIVVPESFLLHEKDMLEFLDKKHKVPRKKGRSMPGFDDEERELELHSVLPYTGRQFSTSIIRECFRNIN